MHLAYIDDTSDKDCGLAMIGAILIEDKHFHKVEGLAGMVVEDLLPSEKLNQFEEFHAAELYGGHKIFEGIDEVKRFHAIEILLKVVRSFEMSFVYSVVDTRALSLSAFGGASPLDVAFRMCALGIEKQVARPGGEELCLFIMDDTKDARLKNQLKCSFSSLRKRFGPPTWNSGRLWSVHDDMYFGASKDSVGIQIADLCNYFVARKLKMNGGEHSFYDIFSDRVICSKIEPEWTQFRASFMELGVQVAQ